MLPYNAPMIDYSSIFKNSKIVIKRKKVNDVLTNFEYYNISAAFDIETSSFLDKSGDKSATMYLWSCAIEDLVVYGRTWQDWLELTELLTSIAGLNHQLRLVIYVHNLAYEFAFMRKWFTWSESFFIDVRKPSYCVSGGIEYRCSYILSGMSLAMLAKTYHLEDKLVGDLDYDLIRHSKTPLTTKELGYSERDVVIVVAYIRLMIEKDGDITKIKMTNTSYVRDYCRRRCFGLELKIKNQYQAYHRLMKKLTLTPEELEMCKRAFAGGFTHSNPGYTNEIISDVTSEDFTSAYPTVLISEMYPMSEGELVKIRKASDLKYNLEHYCCIFDVKLKNYRQTFQEDFYISKSKCFLIKGGKYSNGRVIKADELAITLTDVDFKILEKIAKWDEIEIGKFYIYRKAYLPTPIVESCLHFYSSKTTLKGVDDKEDLYLLYKGMLNSIYGCMVTAIDKELITYDSELGVYAQEHKGIDALVDCYNTSKTRFLFYPWGVYITAYNRANLWAGILEAGEDYIYSDTDSIKIKNITKHQAWLDAYNKEIIDKLERACKYHKLNPELLRPKTVKGVEKPLGVWDFDGHYEKFKTLGAKRYLTYDGKEYHLTCAGLNKKLGMEFLKNFKNPFKEFKDDMTIPAEYSGRLVMAYLDYEQSGEVVDYLGNSGSYHELTTVHSSKSDFNLSMDDEFLRYIESLQAEVINIEEV